MVKIPQAAAAALATRATVDSNCNVDFIKSMLPSNATVFHAEHYDTNSTFSWDIEINYGSTTSPHPTYNYTVPRAGCYIQANISLPENTQHSVGIILPDEWNNRFMAVGNGEFAGSVGWGSIVDASWYGFATVSSDLGHEGNNGSFGYHNEAALQNFGWRALHDAVVNTKTIISGYYGQNSSYNYYRGCSAGGKQGLKEVELFPEDFDGVIAGAPAWWFKHLQLYVVANTLWNSNASAPGHLDADTLTAIATEVTAQCDPQDGVTDGILQTPLSCTFDPSTLLCGGSAGADNSTCLNTDQIATLNKMHSDWTTGDNDTFVFPGWTLGTEASWSATGPSDDFVTYIQYMLQIGGQWTTEDWSDDLISLSDRLNPGNATADDFDISPFYNRGGKLIHYHGLADPSIPTGSSFYFYDQVNSTLGPQGINLDDFYRYFPVPGMEHCEMTSQDAPWYFSGDGQNTALGDTSVHGVPGFQDAQHDIVLAVMAWVENGTAPDSLIATRYTNDLPDDGVAIQRPLCPHPSLATYSGTGNTSLPENWSCV